MLKYDRLTRDMLAERLRCAIDETVVSQLRRGAQEPPITSKVAGAIEHQLHGEEINGYKVRVVAQDFTASGKGSGERRSGADLYIGIEVDGSAMGLPCIAKGLLIQARSTCRSQDRRSARAGSA